jgi:hypothetical protein
MREMWVRLQVIDSYLLMLSPVLFKARSLIEEEHVGRDTLRSFFFTLLKKVDRAFEKNTPCSSKRYDHK